MSHPSPLKTNQHEFSNPTLKAHGSKNKSQAVDTGFSSDVPTIGATPLSHAHISGLIKDRDGHGLQIKRRETMRLITRFELASKNKNELHVILRQAFNELAKSTANTHERRNALASIENIQREISSRAPSP